MTTTRSFKAPQKSLQTTWKGIESFKQNKKPSQAIKVVSYSKGNRKHVITSHWGERKGSNLNGYQY